MSMWRLRSARPDGVRRLVVTSDDFGYTDGVNLGILEAHRAGVVTSVSMMVNAPGFEHAVRAAAGAPGLGVGLHLNLVQGRPLTRARSLTDPGTGRFHPLGRLALRALAGLVDRDDVRVEAAAQIDALRARGIRPTHLDGHRHAHLLPGVWGPSVEAALAAGIDVVRRPREPFGMNALDLRASSKKALLAAAVAAAAPRGVRSPDHFIGVSLPGRRDSVRRLLRALDALEPGTTELMVHAGRADAALVALDPYAGPRELELQALTSVPVRERLRRGDIELIHFGVL